MTYLRSGIAAAAALLTWSTSGTSAGARVSQGIVVPCRATDSLTLEHLHYLRGLAHDPGTLAGTWRSGTLVPLVADTTSQIYPVLDSTTCAQALTAYKSTAQLSEPTVTEVEVLRADTVLVVSHPDIRSGEFVMRYVFDSSFRLLGAYLK